MNVSVIVKVIQQMNTYFFQLTPTTLLCPEKDQSQINVVGHRNRKATYCIGA